MTTNLAVSMEFVFTGTLNLPITSLVKVNYYRMGALLSNKGSNWSSMLESSQLFAENCMKLMKEETSKSNTHIVTRFDYQNLCFSVQETMDLNEGQPMGLPCLRLV